MTTSSSKYQITDKLPITLSLKGDSDSLWGARFVANHPGLSSQDLAALAAYTLLASFQNSMNEKQTHAHLAKAVFDGDAAPSNSMASESEFFVSIECSGKDVPIGDRLIMIPTVKIVAYRSVEGNMHGDRCGRPYINEQYRYCRGVLELTLRQGMVVVTNHKGWLGSTGIIDYLRKSFDTAVEG